MNKIKGFFSGKSFVYGSGAVVVTAVFIIVMIMINLVTDLFVNKFPIKIDLTQNKLFELSDQTKDFLKDLDTDISITMFYELGGETREFKEILDRFQKESPHIKLQTIDPVKNPIFVQKYTALGQNITTGSFLFECGNSTRLLSESDLVATNPITNQKDMLVAESKFTSAILTVQNQNPGTIAIINGHGETQYSEAQTLLTNENYKVSEVDTKTAAIPENTDVAILIAPQIDFTAEEITKLDQFLNAGKNLQVYLDVTTPQLPKLEEFLSEWGLVFERNLIVEGDSKSIFTNDPTSIIPVLQDSDMTKSLISNKISVRAPIARNIAVSTETAFGTTLKVIMKTTDKSYAKASENISSYQKESQDKAGPFNIAVLATKEKGKIFAVGTSYLLHKSLIEGNQDLFMNSVKTMVGGADQQLSISPKSLSVGKVDMTGFQIQMWLIIVVVLIPLAVLILGIIVWSRRRHL